MVLQEIFKGLMDLFSQFKNMVTQPVIFMGAIGIIAFLVIGYVLVSLTRPEKRVLYFSEEERIANPLDVESMTSKSIFTEDGKRFIRNTIAYNLKEGWKNVTLWLAKKGIAYTFKPADTPEGKAVKIGSLYKALETLWGKDAIDQLEDEKKQELINSEIFVTVELESGIGPEDLPKLSEDDVLTDADRNIAELIGSRIKAVLHQEDWIRNMGLVGIGVALTYVLQNLGIL